MSKPPGLNYDQYCQGYIHYSNRRHANAAKTSSNFEKKKNSRILIPDKFYEKLPNFV